MSCSVRCHFLIGHCRRSFKSNQPWLMSTAGDDWATEVGGANRESAAASRVIGVPESDLMGMTTSLQKLSLQAGLRRNDCLAAFSSPSAAGAGGLDPALGSSSSREEPHPHQLCSICLGRLDDGEAAIEQEKRTGVVDVSTDVSPAEEAVAPDGSPTEEDGSQLLQVSDETTITRINRSTACRSSNVDRVFSCLLTVAFRLAVAAVRAYLSLGVRAPVAPSPRFVSGVPSPCNTHVSRRSWQRWRGICNNAATHTTVRGGSDLSNPSARTESWAVMSTCGVV